MPQSSCYGFPGGALSRRDAQFGNVYSLFGYWPLSDPSGSTTALDMFRGYRLTVSGSVTFGNAGPFAGSGSALFASGGYLAASVNVGGYSKLTVAAWVKTNVSDGAKHIIYSDRGNGVVFMTGPNAVAGGAAYNLTIEQDAGSTAYGRGSTGQPINDNNWHYVVGVIDGAMGSRAVTDFKLYLDGAEVTTYSNDTFGGYNWPSNPASFRIGQGTAINAPWSGYISELTIHRRAMTASEILSRYSFFTG